MSNTVRTTVFAWVSLQDVPNTVEGTILTNSVWGDAIIGGTPYSASLVNQDEWMFNDDWWAGYIEEFTLGYKCKSFRASVGVLDVSDRGLNVKFSADLDASRVDFGPMALGPARAVSADVSGVLKLALNVESGPGVVNYDVDGYAGWGTPQVLCFETPRV
jgi:hypothetical protein